MLCINEDPFVTDGSESLVVHACVLGIAYHALNAWVQERGHRQRGAVREIYRNDPNDVLPEELETEVLMPTD